MGFVTRIILVLALLLAPLGAYAVTSVRTSAPSVRTSAPSTRSYSSSSSSRTSTSAPRTSTSQYNSFRSVPSPTKTYSYNGGSYNYTHTYNSFSLNNMLLWYLIINSATQDAAGDGGRVRDIYEDQYDSLKDRMNRHEKVPDYEDTVKAMVEAFGKYNISPQEIGSTMYHAYASRGPAPAKQL